MSSGTELKSDVVLIHGLAAHRWLMLPLAWRIHNAGFRIRNYGYRSMFGTISSQAARLSEYLKTLEQAADCEQFHIVAHSLGAIITRQVLVDHGFQKLGRVVMLAPPNEGSPAAARLSRWLLPMCKTLKQLSDEPGSFVRTMGTPAGIDVGVVTASYDFVVTDVSSRLDGESDRVRVFGGHNGLLVRRPAADAAVRFLHDGHF